jgi:predicted dehydrogenase
MVSGKQEETKLDRKLRMGMVGGGRDAFIGAVHRRAAMFDGGVELVAGAFASTREKSRASGRDLYLPDSRIYGSWQEMVEAESRLPEEERIDFVSIVTPNHLHFPIAKGFLEAGFDVVCDKPMTTSSADAHALIDAVEQTGKVFALTHNYTGYPMVKQARHMVHQGRLGKVQKIVVEYPQGWLLTKLEDTGQKQAAWRTDPKQAGISSCMGDIGTHAENLAAYITGLEIEELCADLTTFVPGRLLEDDGAVLIHYAGGARGVLMASQISTGEENNLRIRVYGTEGALEWRQENPNYLYFAPKEGPRETLTRGSGYLCEATARASRLPTGHPEAFYEAFANIYANAADTMRARLLGREPTALELDFPTVYDGAKGVFFVEKVVESAHSQQKWIPARWTK